MKSDKPTYLKMTGLTVLFIFILLGGCLDREAGLQDKSTSQGPLPRDERMSHHIVIPFPSQDGQVQHDYLFIVILTFEQPGK